MIDNQLDIKNNSNLKFSQEVILHKEMILKWSQEDHVTEFFYDGCAKAFSLDLLIGKKNFLGRGLAHVMIQQFILDQYADADYFIIDPEAENTKAIHVYEKAGFKKTGDCPAFNPKPPIMMRLIVDELRKSL